MAKIASKQLIRAGDLATLQEKLIERELGLCTTDRLLYVKYGDELIPAGDGAVPVPTSKSLFMGEEDGVSDWVDLEQVKSPYEEDTFVWVSLDGVKFAAEFAYKDADGRPIASNAYVIPRVPDVYGPIRIENDASSHFLKVSVGDSGMIGGLVPAEPPSAPAGSEDPASFSEGDLLVAHTPDGGEGPALSWVHPDDVPVENSKMPTTSGAVYTIRKFIDPNLYNPNTGLDFVIEAVDGGTLSTTYEVGKYYIFGDILYRCTSFSSVKAEFSYVEGLVTALNDTLDTIPNVVVYEYELDKNYCRAADGSFVNAETVLTAMAAGKMPLLLLRSARGAAVMGMATIVSGGSNVLFRSSPADNGSFVEYSNDLSSATNTWTATPKSISGEGIVYVGQGVSFDEVTAIISSGKLPVIRVVAGQGYYYYYPTWIGSALDFICVQSDGTIWKYHKFGGADWELSDVSPVFYATYGYTTFSDMKTAYDAGKQVFVRLERNSPPITYTFIAPLVNYTDAGSGIKAFQFYVINSSGEWARATLDDSYGWSQSFG